MSHATHANAALTPRARLRLARLIVDQGWPVARAAERYDVSWRTATKWADAVSRSRGRPGWSTGPRGRTASPNRTPQPVVRKIVHLRWKQRLGPVADRRPARDAGLDRARGAGAVPAQPAHPRRPRHRRADPPLRARAPRRPAPRGRQEARQRPRRRRLALRRPPARRARTGPRPRPHRRPQQAPQPDDRAPRYVHTVIDDHSRVAYAEIHDDETKETAAAVLRNAVAWFADRGVTVERVLSDNGSCYRVPPVARHLRRARHHPQTDPALPAADQRQDRALPPHPGRGLGLQEVLHLRDQPAWPLCQHGSTSTTTTGPTPRSARPHPSPG